MKYLAVARPSIGGDDRAVPAGLRQPHAGLPSSGEEPRRGRAACGAGLQELGILRKSGHEHFNGSLVIPVFDASGQVVEMYGRKITANLRDGTPDHLYLRGEHRGVWNEEALIASKDIILCEALIDAMTFWVAGYRQVTASYGVNGFTEDHRRGVREARHEAGVHRLRPRRGGQTRQRRSWPKS